jgi:hypothetical protein
VKSYLNSFQNTRKKAKILTKKKRKTLTHCVSRRTNAHLKIPRGSSVI